MEQLISDIESYCAARGISPQKFLRETLNAKWSQWQDWKDGKASPTVATADRLRAVMAGGAQDHVTANGESSPVAQGDAA